MMSVSAERRELLLFDALRVGLGYVHGREREEIRRALREAGMQAHHAADGCESWHWPGHAPVGPCQHGLPYGEERPS